MAGSIRSNNSAYGGVDVTAEDLTTFTWGGWFKPEANTYSNGDVYQEISWTTAWAYSLGVSLETDTDVLFFDGPTDANIATGGNTEWRYAFWTKSGTTVTAKIRAQGTSTWTTLGTWTITDTELEYVALLQSTWPFGVGTYNSSVRSWRLWSVAKSDADMTSESDSRTPVDTANLRMAVADGETPNPAATNWNGAAYGSITFGTNGTPVYETDDPITGGGDPTLTGYGLSIAVVAGDLGNTPQVIGGYGLGIAAVAGSIDIGFNVGQLPQWFSEKLVKPRWFDRSLEKAAWFSRYYADSGDAPSGLTGLGLGIAVAHGGLGVTGALTLTGQAVSIATAAGSVSVPPDSIVGRALSIAAAIGNLGPSGAYTLAGQTLAIAGAHGAPGSATGIGSTGQFLGLALAAGTLGAADSLGLAGQGATIAAAAGALASTSPGALTGQGVSIAATAGTPGAATAYALTGQTAAIAAASGALGATGSVGPVGQFVGVAVAHGSLGVSDALALAGQALGILAAAGSVTPPGTLAGQGANIASTTGALGTSSALGVTGQFLGVALAHGTLGPLGAYDITGRTAAIAVAAGALATPGGGTLAGLGLSIAAAHGALGSLGAYAIGGATATITAAVGSLATPSGGALTGFGLGIAAAHGALGTSATVVPLGQFIGIALAAGDVGLPGESVTRTPAGQALGIATQAAWLTWVEYGPPVDAALRARHIADNEAILQFAAANVWRWHLPAGTELPKGFPYLSQLNAAGYTMPRHVKAATEEELDAAGFTARQITAILTAAEKL